MSFLEFLKKILGVNCVPILICRLRVNTKQAVCKSSRSNEDVKALKQVAGRGNSEQKYTKYYTLYTLLMCISLYSIQLKQVARRGRTRSKNVYLTYSASLHTILMCMTLYS